MPDELGLLAEHVLGGVIGVVIAVRTGKDDDAEFHVTSSCQLPSASCASRNGWKLEAGTGTTQFT
jgi:hypothetical protein